MTPKGQTKRASTGQQQVALQVVRRVFLLSNAHRPALHKRPPRHKATRALLLQGATKQDKTNLFDLRRDSQATRTASARATYLRSSHSCVVNMEFINTLMKLEGNRMHVRPE